MASGSRRCWITRRTSSSSATNKGRDKKGSRGETPCGGWKGPRRPLPAGGPAPAGAQPTRLSRIPRILETARATPKEQTLVPVSDMFQMTRLFTAADPSRDVCLLLCGTLVLRHMSFPLRLGLGGASRLLLCAMLAMRHMSFPLQLGLGGASCLLLCGCVGCLKNPLDSSKARGDFGLRPGASGGEGLRAPPPP